MLILELIYLNRRSYLKRGHIKLIYVKKYKSFSSYLLISKMYLYKILFLK
jgi:hypothetical protein